MSRLSGTLRRPILQIQLGSPRLLALILVAVTLAVVWINASSTQFIPCNQDCGETFIAQQSSANYRLYGTRYLLLEDRSTIPDIDRRPYLYTHNVNLAGLVFPLLDELGISKFWAKQVVTLAVFGLGVFYVFLTVSYVTRSAWAGLSVLALFCSDYGQVFLFALNALRAWHWLALFGLVFHSCRLLTRERATRCDFAAVSVFAILTFGVGYEFLAIALGITSFLAVLCARSLKRCVIVLAWLAASVLLIFTIRQAQVAAVLGIDFWARDFFYSAVIKVTSLAVYFQIPSLAEIDAYYQSKNVFRPFAAVAPLDQVLLGIKQHIEGITLPSIGVGAIVSGMLGFVVAAVVVLVWALGRLAKGVGLLRVTQTASTGHWFADGLKYRAGDWLNVNLTARFYTALMLGTAASLGAFGSVAISIYLKHQMPLMAAVVLIPKGIFIALCVRLAWEQYANVGLRTVAAALGVLLIVDHAAIQYQNVQALRPIPVGWIPEVAKRPDASFAVSWIPSSVAGFTQNWVVGVQPGLERRIIDRANRHETLFNNSDLLEVNILDKEDMQKYRMLQPDYWLYYATDQKAEVQANVPACIRSYSRRLFDEWATTWVQPELARANFADRGGNLFVAGELNVTGRAIEAIEFSIDNKLAGRVGMACDATTFSSVLPSIPAQGDERQIAISAVGYNGQRYALGTPGIALSDQPANLPASPPQRQPSAEALIELNQSLPIAAKGPGFVLFDLRSLWQRS